MSHREFQQPPGISYPQQSRKALCGVLINKHLVTSLDRADRRRAAAERVRARWARRVGRERRCPSDAPVHTHTGAPHLRCRSADGGSMECPITAPPLGGPRDHGQWPESLSLLPPAPMEEG